VYSEINITLEVKTEYGESLPSWILTKKVSDQKYQQFLEMEFRSRRGFYNCSSDTRIGLINDFR